MKLNRITSACIIAILACALSAGLAALPYAFNVFGDGGHEYNERLQVVWFLSLAMPGLLISGLVGVSAHKSMFGHPKMMVIGTALILVVALPLLAFYGDDMADRLLPWYLLLSAIMGGMLAWQRTGIVASKSIQHY